MPHHEVFDSHVKWQAQSDNDRPDMSQGVVELFRRKANSCKFPGEAI